MSARASALGLLLLSLLMVPASVVAKCTGSIVNPLTETSWSCLYPIRMAGVRVSPSAPDPEAYLSQPLCSCQDGANLRVGLIMGFREPSRLEDTVKDAWCFAGFGMDLGSSNVWGDGGSEAQGSKRGIEQGYSAEVHSYFYNPLYLMELLLDMRCMEKIPVGISDLSEVRPDHKDGPLNLMLYPETLLFSNPIATAACMADAVGATAGYPLDALFWCAGSWGSVYPMTGTSQQKGGTNVEAAANVAAKSIARGHRNLTWWGTKGQAALCGMYPQPVWMKSQYKLQPVRPIRSALCPPIGRTELLWGAGNNPPVPQRADNFSYMVWRWRDCCSF